MTQDEIIEMYMQVSKELCNDTEWCWAGVGEPLQMFAHLVAAKATEEANAKANASWTLMCKKMVAIEREACAKLIDPTEEHRKDASWGYIGGNEGVEMLDDLAALIRARGEQA